MKRLQKLFTALGILLLSHFVLSAQFVLERDRIRLVYSEEEDGPLLLAVNALAKDLNSVMLSEPVLAGKINRDTTETEIVIVNTASGKLKIPSAHRRELDGFESHRVYVNEESRRIYLLGSDLRGTIYAIYTFSEEVLGVPPLKYWSSWKPDPREKITLPEDYDRFFKSPQVRYRSLLPGDQDFFNPWRKESEAHENIWLETALRLKLNTIETYSTIRPHYALTDYAYLISSYGLVITSHHTSGLNTSFSTWADYWREMRNMEPPEYLLSDEQAILDFFRYNAETVQRNGIENLWSVAFRGERDQPFWSIFKDAPEDEQERAGVINRMLQIQYDLIKEVTGEAEPYARITFYDELAILMAKGYLKAPESENMILTFVAGRRDHYPYDDIVNFESSGNVKLGYYMNFGFASTGAHISPAESPWKMEFNFRYVNHKAPLFFSVVNVGNFREFVLELAANAKMLWDFSSYSTDRFLHDYCAQYFGESHADEIALLYKEFYEAYWIPKKSEFEGLERQFVFQDLRYARAFDHTYSRFFEPETDMNPLHKIGYESIPGRTFRIDTAFNNAPNQVDAILNGMQLSIPKFETLAARCSRMMLSLNEDRQVFFNDNLRIHCYYMTHLSKALYHYMYAYKHQKNTEALVRHLELAHMEAVRAQNYLFEAEHGVFSTWYTNAEDMSRTFQINELQEKILLLRDKALSKLNSSENETKTIVYVNSYHEGFPPSDQITRGLMEHLPADGLRVHSYFMDTKRNPSEAYIRQKAADLMDSISIHKPEVLIVSDDNALKYLVVPNFQGHPLPIVFCGVNWSVAQYDLSGCNISGILEILPVADLVQLVRSYSPGMKKLLVLNENTTTARKTQPILDTLLGNLGFEVSQELVDDFESWKSAFARANDSYDLIYLQTKGAISGWDDEAARAHVEEFIRIPVLTCEEFMMPFSVFGLTQLSQEQGILAAEYTKLILNGTDPANLPVGRNKLSRAMINQDLARLIGFEPDDELQKLLNKD